MNYIFQPKNTKEATLNAATELLELKTKALRGADALHRAGKMDDETLWGFMERRGAAWEAYFDAYEAVTGRQPRDCFGVSAV